MAFLSVGVKLQGTLFPLGIHFLYYIIRFDKTQACIRHIFLFYEQISYFIFRQRPVNHTAVVHLLLQKVADHHVFHVGKVKGITAQLH